MVGSTEDKGALPKIITKTKMNCVSRKYKHIHGKLTDEECIIIEFVVVYQKVTFFPHGTAEDAK